MLRTISRRRFGFAVLAPLLPVSVSGCRRRGSAPEFHDAKPRSPDAIEIDAAIGVGQFQRLSGVQGSPAPILDGEPTRVIEFRTAGIQRSRFPQDCFPNTLTLGGIFPDENADPDSEASYHFEAIDKHVRAARDAGVHVLWQSSYDVGRTDRWEGVNLGGRPPANLERWGRVVARCLEHFNNGWGSGFERCVDAVEFVNEPSGLGGFTGPDAKRLGSAFLAFLDTIERYNRAHPDSAVRAVGPGIPLSLAEWPEWQPRFDKSLAEITKAGKSWPVFSFHTYGDDVSPKANEGLARAFRTMLDRHGMRQTELWNTEWQAGDFVKKHLSVTPARAARATDLEKKQFASALAAYVVACKLRWQGVVSGSCYYRANERAFPPGHKSPFANARAGRGGFFGSDGQPGTLALQERLMGLVADATPERCKTQFADDGLLAVAGLRSADGKKLSILASSLAVQSRELAIHVRGHATPAGAPALLTLLDGDLGSRELPASPSKDGSVSLAVSMPPLSTIWITIG